MRESVATRAVRLLSERRVDVRWRDQRRLVATVIGDSAVAHNVTWSTWEGWRCDCTAAVYRSNCSHLAAVQHITVINRTTGETP